MTHPQYALDADVLASFQRARQDEALAAAGRLPVVITDTVWDELVLGPILKMPVGISTREEAHRRAQAEAMEEVLRSIAGGRTEILAGSPEATNLARLQRAGSVGQGEDSVIALAVSRPDVVPVMIDRAGLARAIEEVPGRVLSLHGFLRTIERDAGFPRGVSDAVSAYLQKAKSFVPPLWWQTR